MTKKSLAIALLLPSQETSEQPMPKKERATEYEKFLDRTGVLVLSKTYPIGKTKGLGAAVSALVAWASSEPDRVYAARVGASVVDYDDLKAFAQEVDKITQAVNGLVEKSDWSDVRYKSLTGLKLEYFIISDDPGSRRVLNVTYRDLLIASGYGSEALLQLQDLRNLIAQAREKLISLGAK